MPLPPKLAGPLHPSYLLNSIRSPSRVIVASKGFYAHAHGRGSGRAVETPALSDMPSYRGVVEERDYYDIVEFLRTLR